MTESSSSGVGAVDPELCRVSVIGGNTQLDVGLPATVPVAAYITDLVELIDSRNPDLTEHDEGAPVRAQHWTLARIGRDPIPPHQSLTDAEVFDGELLVLRSVTAKEAPALFDDVIDAVSRLTAESGNSWSPTAARRMGLGAGLIAVIIAVAVLVAGKGTGVLNGFIALGAGVLAAGAAVIVARRYPPERMTAIVLSLYAIALLGSSAGLLTPGWVGAPHLLFSAVAALVIALALYSATRAGAFVVAAVVTTAAIVAVAAAVRMVWDFDIPKIAVGALIAGLVLITMAPRVAVAAARLPVPPVPTAGGAIDPTDHEPRPTIADIGVIGATALPSAAGLEQRARAANQYQSGILAGAVVAAGAGAILGADPLGGARWQGLVLAAITAVVLCLRGRAYADLVQASTMIAGGALVALAVTAGAAVSQEDWRSAGAGLLLVVAAAVLAFGVLGPRADVSPVVRRAIEIFEYLLIIAIVPLSLWLMDVYSAARNI
ncbi:type VII secretion integral membrane protein EccD-like protein [Nocardia nova SH22a]|uniref:Type VII secretion integral membrane protein EccD-like protein n=1 Tax=Nocardia nova SH22a TaxID=1415166 RepID=W5T8U5_9NOCA|nr:type VII secretion integral membrane protein EccD [Nocardia nova]AHH15750.1 type VII secretion integral membrane protein EccD-like protein [Nocardia nova SH22a]